MLYLICWNSFVLRYQYKYPHYKARQEAAKEYVIYQ